MTATLAPPAVAPAAWYRRREMFILVPVLIAVIIATLNWASNKSASDAQADQVFLNLTAYNDSLSAVDVTTRITLGHQACSLLSKHHGDLYAAESELEAQSSVWTVDVTDALFKDAQVAYCS